MDEAKAEQNVVDRLSHGAARNELIEELCLEYGLSWKQAEEFVARAAQKNAWRIAGRQMPYWILLSLVVLLAGLTLVYFSLAGWLAAIWSQVLVPGDVMPIFTDTFWLTIHFPQLALGAAVTAAGAVAMRRFLADMQSGRG